jgi:hypothetical protein
MMRNRKWFKSLVFVTTALALSFGIPLFPSLATESSDLALGTTQNFSIVSGGVIVLGASATFTGGTPIQAALSPATIDTTTVATFTNAGINNFYQDSTTAVQALADLVSLKSQLDSLTGVTRSPELGGETLTAGVYLPTGDAAFSITTPLVLDGGGNTTPSSSLEPQPPLTSLQI